MTNHLMEDFNGIVSLIRIKIICLHKLAGFVSSYIYFTEHENIHSFICYVLLIQKLNMKINPILQQYQQFCTKLLIEIYSD